MNSVWIGEKNIKPLPFAESAVQKNLFEYDPVQTPNFSWGIIRIKVDPNYLDRLISIPAEQNSKGEKCSFRSNCLQNTL